MDASTKLIGLLRAQVKDTISDHNKRTSRKCYLNSNLSFFWLYTNYLSPGDLDNSLFGPYVIHRKLDSYNQNCKLLAVSEKRITRKMFEPLQKDAYSVGYSTKKSKSDTVTDCGSKAEVGSWVDDSIR